MLFIMIRNLDKEIGMNTEKQIKYKNDIIMSMKRAISNIIHPRVKVNVLCEWKRRENNFFNELESKGVRYIISMYKDVVYKTDKEIVSGYGLDEVILKYK